MEGKGGFYYLSEMFLIFEKLFYFILFYFILFYFILFYLFFG